MNGGDADMIRTIETIATVADDGKLTVQVQLPPGIEPGQRQVVLVIDEAISSPREALAPLPLQVFEWPGWDAQATYRREELYPG
jgi:hypothetical protein